MLPRPFVRLALPAARIVPVAVAGVATVALVSGCGSSGGAAATSSAPASSAAAPSASPSLDIPSPAASTAAPAPSESASVPTDPAYVVADAIIDQLTSTQPDNLSDELVTIAVSPQLRQLADAYKVTTAIDVKGPRVTLTIEGDGQTCVVTVADTPNPARGFVCS